MSPGAFWVLPGWLLGAKAAQDNSKYTVWGLTPGSYIERERAILLFYRLAIADLLAIA